VAVLRGWLESTGPATADALSVTLGFSREEIDTALARLEGEGQVLRGRFRNHEGDVEWCNRRILARIHRLTIGRLRSAIEPVAAAQFHAFLARWQHVAPGTQLHGADGVLEIVRQLQGYEVPASAWETQVLPARVAAYKPGLLDDLCLSGEVMWGRVSDLVDPETVRASRVARLALFLRDDAGWIRTPLRARATGAIVDVLETERALFFADIVRLTGMTPSEVEDALWWLAAAGTVTADGFENLRALMDPRRRRRDGRGGLNRRRTAGRWALLPPATAAAERVERWAEQLLRRWGVLLRDLLAREPAAPPWRDLLIALRRMEARGQIRGGRFVSGFTGEQFAMPEAVDLLRSTRRTEAGFDVDSVSNADPLNLTGIILPGPRVSPLAVAIPVLSAAAG
jgi:ATP-dependent Lhr-like helicase